MSESTRSPKRRHPARRARKVAGALSAAGLLSLTGFMAASSVTTATATTSKVTTNTVPAESQSTAYGRSMLTYDDDSENWSATPAPGPSSTSSNSYVADTSSHAS
ncbi:MAG: hypothetical protein ACXW1S_03790 [Acidimicrobiia bacterium]